LSQEWEIFLQKSLFPFFDGKVDPFVPQKSTGAAKWLRLCFFAV